MLRLEVERSAAAAADTASPRRTLERATAVRPLVECRTAEFSFTIAVRAVEAPVSSAYFLSAVDTGAMDGSSIFRMVNLRHHTANHPHKIQVIQMGHLVTDEKIPPTIRHESTDMTGLRHLQGTVSLARFAPGAVYHSFFVCMRDEPSLDAGGLRNPDGQGFAAFGFVTAGFDRLRRLFENNTLDDEYLANPIPFQAITRVSKGSIGV